MYQRVVPDFTHCSGPSTADFEQVNLAEVVLK